MPVCKAVLRAQPADFHVDEHLGIEADGAGEHDFLTIRKTGANTAWVARQLARHAGVAAVDVGYSGLKDRNAVTRQAFTVRRPNRDGTDWSTLDVEGVELQQIARHSRKIRRGTHKYNRFEIVLRGNAVARHREALEERIAVIGQMGVPNYFGEQRFGRGGSNIELARAVLAGKRVKRDARGMAISSARSLIFNAIVDARVRDGSWNQILDGELANLDGTGSVFAVDAVNDELERRCREQDIHPTATLWGDAAPGSTGATAALEQSVAARFEEFTVGLHKARVDASQRPLRLLAQDLSHEFVDDGLLLRLRARPRQLRDHGTTGAR